MYIIATATCKPSLLSKSTEGRIFDVIQLSELIKLRDFACSLVSINFKGCCNRCDLLPPDLGIRVELCSDVARSLPISSQETTRSGSRYSFSAI